MFLGQTNLTPFTYEPPTARPSSESHDIPGGFVSEASSAGTITRIPRNRFRRAKPERSFRRPLQFPSPEIHANKGKGRALTSTTPVPQSTPKPLPTFLSGQRSLVTQTNNVPAQSTLRHRLSPPIRQEQPHDGFASWQAYQPAGPSTVINPQQQPMYVPMAQAFSSFGLFGHTSASYRPETPVESPWTAVPMSIDPRSGDSRHPSWPQPLTARENGRSTTPGGPSRLLPIVEESSSTLTNDKVPRPVHSPIPGLTRGLQLPSAPPSRPPVILPIAKACHNFLLARRVQSAKRRRLLWEHVKRVTEADNRPHSPMIIDQPLAIAFTSQTHSDTDTIRPMISIARVDESRPPRKRRRDRSPSDQSWLLPPADIIGQKKKPSVRADFSTMLRRAINNPHDGFVEREARQAAWLEEEQRRAAAVIGETKARKRFRDWNYK